MTEERPRKKSLHQGRFLEMFELEGWEYVDRIGSSGVVVILAVTDANELVLVEQHRIPVGSRVIELPAGLAGDLPDAEDEDFKEAARRELLEETGYEAENIKFLCEGPPTAGLTSEIQTRIGLVVLMDVQELRQIVPTDKIVNPELLLAHPINAAGYRRGNDPVVILDLGIVEAIFRKLRFRIQHPFPYSRF